MLNSDRRYKRPPKKRNRREPVGKRAPSRLETSAHAARFTVRGRKRGFSLAQLARRWRAMAAEQRRPRQRRSKARLPKRERKAPQLKTVVLESARASLQLNWSLVANVLALGLLGWALTWFFVSDRFYVDRIVVNGNIRVSEDTIRAASGIEGYSIFWVNPRRVAAAIRDSLPPVQGVRVQCGLPNKVTLIVQERGEQIMWQVMGQLYWVDEEGYLHPAQGPAEPKLVVRDIRPGPPVQVEDEVMVAARQIVQLLPDVRAIEYAPLTGLRLTHPRGWVVYLGTGDDMARKVSVLQAIEIQFAGEDAAQPSLIDLRFPDSPYYRVPDEEGGGL